MNRVEFIEEELMRICSNPDCNWEGKDDECVHPKHSPEDLLCPLCHEVTEVKL